MMDYDIEPILAEAQKFIVVNSRKAFDPYYAIVEDFSLREGLPHHGNIGITLACKESRPLNVVYELYSDTPYKTALDLTNELFALQGPLHVYMRTDIKHMEMTILIDTIEAVKIYRMDRFASIKLIDIVDTERVPGFFGGEVIVFSPLIYLMTIYRYLYSPVRFTQDPKLLERAEILRRNLFSMDKVGSNDTAGNIDNASNIDTAGNIDNASNINTNGNFSNLDANPNIIDLAEMFGADDIDSIGEIIGAGKQKRRQERSRVRSLPSISVINAAMLDEFSEHVLVGELAAEFHLSECKLNDPPRVQFISNEAPEIIAKRLAKITSADVTFKQYKLFTDFQLVRTTFFVGGNNPLPCMDVYNSDSYEMIPWDRDDSMKVGNPFVVARFLCVEIFSMKVISAISKVSFDRRLEVLMKLLQDIGDIAPKFQLENYAGVYLAENVQKKKILAAAEEKPPPYFPEMGIKKI